MLMVLEKLQEILEKMDSAKDSVFFMFIKPYWPRKITPNHITWIRVFISILIFILLFWFEIHDKVLIVSLFCVGALTDLLDGPVARGTNRVTEFGAMLDPLADRLLIFPIAVYSLYPGHKWLLLALFLMEIFNTLIYMFYKSRKEYLESNIFGKTKMVILSVVFVAVLIVWPNGLSRFFIWLLWGSLPFSFFGIFMRLIELNSKGYIKNRIIKKQLNKYDTQDKDI